MRTEEQRVLDRPLLALLGARFGSNAANQMQAMIIGWQVYLLTDSAWSIAFVGLTQFLPGLFLALISGQVADSYDRKMILARCYMVEMTMSACLGLLSTMEQPPIWLFYVLLLVNATARGFEGPAANSLLPTVVPRERLSRAVPIYSTAGRMSTLSGPMIGGLVYGFGGPVVAYSTVFSFIALAFVAMTQLPKLPPAPGKRDASWAAVLAGVSFIWSYPPLLGAMTLDMVATMFGGVVALLPIFARDILHVGPEGLGVLRSAPAFGAVAMAIWFSRNPIRRNAGVIMFAGMTLYGVATLSFAFSTSFVLSLVMLFLIGAGDMTASAVRQTLIHVCTPDDRRGRVLAANALFNNTSGQLGQFESGVAAALLGAVGSAAFGGVVVFAIVAAWIRLFPDLLRIDNLADVGPPQKVHS